MEYNEKKSWENRLIRRDGLIFSIMLTALTLLNFAQMSFFNFVDIIVSGASLVLQLLLCIGAWLSSFRIRAGVGIVKVILMIYRVLMYVAVGALCLLAMYVFYVTFKYDAPMEAIMIMLLVFAVLIAVVLFWASLYKNAAIIVHEIESRLVFERKYIDTRVCGSWMPGMLLTLGIFYILGLLSDVLLSSAIGGEVVDLIYDQLSNALYRMGDLGYSVTSIGSASGSISNVQDIIKIFICFYGFFYGNSFKKLSLS